MRKYYKENYALGSMERRGQVAIFVIVAIVIVGIILVVYLFPGVNIFSGEVNPSRYLTDCISEDVEGLIDQMGRQGGYINPSHYATYKGERIQYLCYTSRNYETCKVQQPLLRKHVEDEIEGFIKPRAQQCVKDLEEQYEKSGYSVETRPGDVDVRIIPGSLNVEFLSPMTITKENAQTFRKFTVGLNSEMYDLILTATNIIQFESELGNSETTFYLQYYPDLKINKIKRDGDTIYKLNNIVSGEEFSFASRSLVWPQGYGFEE
jgi:hypothetical protein